MLNIFKKKKVSQDTQKNPEFEIELIGAVLAQDLDRSTGHTSASELNHLIQAKKQITKKVNKTAEEIFSIIEIYSKDSVSFHEFIADINNDFSKEEKLSLISFLWDVAFADSQLDVDEERLIRRIADLIRIKDIEVLKLKDKARN